MAHGPAAAGRGEAHLEAVALAGETAPESGGAAFASFGFLSRNDVGRVAFVATLDDGRSGVFVAKPNAPLPVPLLTGPALPLLALLFVGTAVTALRSSA